MGQLEDIEVFIRVVESGGIGRAAEQLDIAKSAVSRRLSELEKRLGNKLINRTTRTSSLTEIGRQYYERALKVSDYVNEMNVEAEGIATSLSGRLRVAVPLSFGLLHLSPAIDLFAKQHPSLTIEMDFSDRQVDIVEEGVDVALRIADMKDSSYQARRLCPVKHVLVASPGYVAREGEPRTVEALAEHQMLKYSAAGSELWQVIDAAGHRQHVDSPTRMVANNGDFLKDMAVAGHGVIILPTFLVWKELACGDLVPLLPDYQYLKLNAYAVYPGNRFLPKKVRLFIDFLAERLGDNPYWDQKN